MVKYIEEKNPRGKFEKLRDGNIMETNISYKKNHVPTALFEVTRAGVDD